MLHCALRIWHLQGIVEGEVHLVGSRAPDTAQDFILQCLRKDPHQRPSAQELLLHPWLQVGSSFTDMDTWHPHAQHSEMAIQLLVNYDGKMCDVKWRPAQAAELGQEGSCSLPEQQSSDRFVPIPSLPAADGIPDTDR